MPARTDRARTAERMVFMIISSGICLAAGLAIVSPTRIWGAPACPGRPSHAPVTKVDGCQAKAQEGALWASVR